METIWLSKLASFSSLFTSYKVGKMRPIPHSLTLFIRLTQPFININYFTAIHHNVISIFFHKFSLLCTQTMYPETNEIVGINFKTNVCIVCAFGSACGRYTYESKLIFYRSSRQGQLKIRFGSFKVEHLNWTYLSYALFLFS